MYFRKKYIEKYDLQESYNNFKIKLKIFLCESGPWPIIYKYSFNQNCQCEIVWNTRENVEYKKCNEKCETFPHDCSFFIALQ